MDQVVYERERPEHLLALLHEHIFSNIIKVCSCSCWVCIAWIAGSSHLSRQNGTRYYRQTTGIPQGSVLSSLLCSLLVGDLERRHFSALPTGLSSTSTSADSQREIGLLMRVIDDMLYITTSREAAVQFLHAMLAGFPEYGCFINAAKRRLNFAYQPPGLDAPLKECRTNTARTCVKERERDRCYPLTPNPVPIEYATLDNRTLLPWCGLLIDTNSLEVLGDYTRLSGCCMFHVRPCVLEAF